MAEQTIRFCDRCDPACEVLGQVTEGPITLSVGRYTDAAGSADTRHQKVDLCPACTNLILCHMLDKNSYDQNIDWIQSVTGRKLQP